MGETLTEIKAEEGQKEGEVGDYGPGRKISNVYFITLSDVIYSLENAGYEISYGEKINYHEVFN